MSPVPASAFLAPDVHAVRVGDDLVILDVAADRYLCWPDAGPLTLSADGRRLGKAAAAVLAEFRGAGLIADAPAPPTVPFRAVLAPEGDLNRPDPRASRWADRVDLLRASLDGAVTYPRRSFAELVAYGAARPPGHDPDAAPTKALQAVVGGFHRWACWTPAPAKCLIRSFMLLRLLRRHGHDARWVFAVRTWPFEAHCWLQAGPVVLDDSVERLVAYRPILVV